MQLEVIRPRLTGSGPAEVPPAPIRLGARMRNLRLSRGWTLEEASEHIGLSRSALSKIEREEASPTFTALQKIAGGFAMDLAEFLTGGQPQPPSGRRSITRRSEAKVQETPNYQLRLLLKDLKRTAFIPYEAVVQARALSEFAEWARHNSEDFIYVLEGTVEFYTELYEPVRLDKGDSAFFDGRMGHACLSIGPDDAVLLCVSAMQD
jgi:transcriptional regulator with XRE-family HTH domain